MVIFCGGLRPPAPPPGTAPLDPACFWIEDSSQNTLASPAYFAKPDFQVFAYLSNFFLKDMQKHGSLALQNIPLTCSD